jgi:DNA (cytosine-5)-methyltransferase 1
VRYLSVCSGIEAASVAWSHLGWRCVGLAEIDPFARAVLSHHFPHVPLHGDFSQLRRTDVQGPVDLLVGGPPCQSFSVSGKRGGLDDERGNLSLEFAALAGRLQAKWVVYENVPNLLRTGGGRDFRALVQALVERGYRVGWRVLDSQYFGVPQRRRRLFLVGHLGGSPSRVARVLFEPEGLRRDPPPRRATGTEIAGALTTGAESGGYKLDDCQVGGGHIQPVAFDITQATHPENRCRFDPGAPVGSLQASGRNAVAYNVFPASGQGSELRAAPTELATQITAAAGAKSSGRGTRVAGEWGVRRLTPREWERLQGFPDDWTLVPWRGKLAPKTRRYKSIGNSMPVPVMRWLGERISEEELGGRWAQSMASNLK